MLNESFVPFGKVLGVVVTILGVLVFISWVLILLIGVEVGSVFCPNAFLFLRAIVSLTEGNFMSESDRSLLLVISTFGLRHSRLRVFDSRTLFIIESRFFSS